MKCGSSGATVLTPSGEAGGRENPLAPSRSPPTSCYLVRKSVQEGTQNAEPGPGGAGEIRGDHGGWRGDFPASPLYSTSALHRGTLGEDQVTWLGRGEESPAQPCSVRWLRSGLQACLCPRRGMDESRAAPGTASLEDLAPINLRLDQMIPFTRRLQRPGLRTC